jgi:hypothetical protein
LLRRKDTKSRSILQVFQDIKLLNGIKNSTPLFWGYVNQFYQTIDIHKLTEIRNRFWGGGHHIGDRGWTVVREVAGYGLQFSGYYKSRVKMKIILF